MTRQTGGEVMAQRAEDSMPVKITREIGLPWVLGVIGAIVLQAGTVWYGQKRQEEILVAQGETIKSLSAEIKAISASLVTFDKNDAKHDMQIADHERRLMLLENRGGRYERSSMEVRMVGATGGEPAVRLRSARP